MWLTEAASACTLSENLAFTFKRCERASRCNLKLGTSHYRQQLSTEAWPWPLKHYQRPQSLGPRNYSLAASGSKPGLHAKHERERERERERDAAQDL